MQLLSRSFLSSRQLLFSHFSSCSAVMEFCCGLSRGQITVTPPLSLAQLISVYFSSHSGIFRQTNPAHSSVCYTPFISLLSSISCKVKFRETCPFFFFTLCGCLCFVAFILWSTRKLYLPLQYHRMSNQSATSVLQTHKQRHNNTDLENRNVEIQVYHCPVEIKDRLLHAVPHESKLSLCGAWSHFSNHLPLHLMRAAQ